MELVKLMVSVRHYFIRNCVTEDTGKRNIGKRLRGEHRWGDRLFGKHSIGKRLICSMDGFGLNEILGIAAAIIIAAFIIIPGMRTFAQTMMTSLSTWWGNISSSIFPTS